MTANVWRVGACMGHVGPVLFRELLVMVLGGVMDQRGAHFFG